jgi:cytochrome c biogenesis protein CcmG/thiol:disulfide interchange protein DsbE
VSRMRRAAPFLAALAVVAIVVIGLVQASDKPAAPKLKAFDLEAGLAQLKGAPAPLAALNAQHGALLNGGVSAFKARIKALRGHPIVINKWGSWCNPCRREFPVFQRAAVEHGKSVAFLGIDGTDPKGDAQRFLKRFPITYPSYRDDNQALAAAVNAVGPFPITVFIDRTGKVVFPHAGPYESVAALSRDIKRYLHA